MAEGKKLSVKNKKMKKPPSQSIKSIQHDLFSDFLTNDISEVSNTVDLWERIPKYFLSPLEQTRLRTDEGLAKPYTQKYALKNQDGEALLYKIKIQPALIEQLDGEYKAFFPTRAEEIIEEVLKKIFTEQNLGIHDSKNTESWVKFSYGMINKELRRNKCSRTHKQIKHSLEIMSKCILTVMEDNKEIYSNPILNNYLKVDRKQYLDDTNSLHIAQLSVFISRGINTLQYRQYNLKRFTNCKEQLSGWLVKRLINRFTYADFIKGSPHKFKYSTIKYESLLLRSSNERKNRMKVIAALDELKKTSTIDHYDVQEKKEGRKIIDVVYTVISSYDFCQEQKAANKRAKIIKEKAIKNKLQVVDN